jgi:hypothetical protein
MVHDIMDWELYFWSGSMAFGNSRDEKDGLGWDGCIDDDHCSIGYLFLVEWNKMRHTWALEWIFKWNGMGVFP